MRGPRTDEDMNTGVVVINFGEPEEPTAEAVVPFLERIFLANAELEDHVDENAARARARSLAEARAPQLIADYASIGGSPLNLQAGAQTDALQRALVRRGHSIRCYTAFQYLKPFIVDVLRRAREDGVKRLVGLPVFPLCGRSTTVAALEEMEREIERLEWRVEVLEIAGWHGHPDYVALHGDHIRRYVDEHDLELGASGTRLLFSVHGTPLKYLESGNRYDRYVDEVCQGMAGLLGVESYAFGFQNHGNRPVAWTQPDVTEVVGAVECDDLVVVAVSFMHEQSETLSELDVELRALAEGRGIRFHRVPIPHDSTRFTALLADLVEGRLITGGREDEVGWRKCVCRGGGKALCTNGMRLDTHRVPVESRGAAPHGGGEGRAAPAP